MATSQRFRPVGVARRQPSRWWAVPIGWDPCYFEADPVTSRKLVISFPTVPWASANAHALAVLTFPAWHLITLTVAGAWKRQKGSVSTLAS